MLFSALSAISAVQFFLVGFTTALLESSRKAYPRMDTNSTNWKKGSNVVNLPCDA